MSATNRSPRGGAGVDAFHTPPWAVARLLEAVQLPVTDRPWLEPCAGDGAIVRAVQAHPGFDRVRWAVVELREDMREPLAQLPGLITPPIVGDFLTDEGTARVFARGAVMLQGNFFPQRWDPPAAVLRDPEWLLFVAGWAAERESADVTTATLVRLADRLGLLRKLLRPTRMAIRAARLSSVLDAARGQRWGQWRVRLASGERGRVMWRVEAWC